MEMIVSLGSSSYPIYIQSGLLDHLDTVLDTKRKYMVVTDDGVPSKWVERVCSQLKNASLHVIPHGEESKCFAQYESLLYTLAGAGMTRKDAIIALGGGVVGDLAGFGAATYMRGIDFFNIPTTVLSQVDSSVGGKTAIDLGPVKNIVGAFWQPKAVLIDPQTLSTLDPRQISNGLAEALKMGLILDPALVDAFEADPLDLEFIITRSVDLKRQVVQEDEKELGLRKILNFGHTIGHALEGSFDLNTYLHGECVGAGMLYFIQDPDLKKRVLHLEKKLGLPKIQDFDAQKAMELLRHDKKGSHETISTISVPVCGSFVIENKSYEEMEALLQENVYEE